MQSHFLTRVVFCATLVAAVDDIRGAEPRVDCPAIRQDNRSRTNYPGETGLPIELIAVIRPIVSKEPDDGRLEIHEADVVQALYGHSDEPRIRIRWPWQLGDQEQIVALAADVYGEKGTYDFKYDVTADAGEIAAMRALATARLDLNVRDTGEQRDQRPARGGRRRPRRGG